MFPIIGFVITFVCVFGAYTLAGGSLNILLGALPVELTTILGGAIGAYFVANKTPVLKGTFAGIKRAFAGSKWKSEDFRQLLSVLYLLSASYKTKGPQGIESHIENPDSSVIFNTFPRVTEDKHVMSFIRDYFRLQTMGADNVKPHQLAEVMDTEIDNHHHSEMEVQHALQTTADALPAIGIVAAVLGVIKTMGSIDQPTEVLGAMIGGALVGTFLGVLLAYCVVGPLASRLKQVIEADALPMLVARNILNSSFSEFDAKIALELGRRMIPHEHNIDFAASEDIIASCRPILAEASKDGGKGDKD